jgi:hypothetical protein
MKNEVQGGLQPLSVLWALPRPEAQELAVREWLAAK